MWLGLSCVDDIGKLHRVLDEKDGNVVPHNVPVAFLSIEFDGEATDISNSICGTSATEYS